MQCGLSGPGEVDHREQFVTLLAGQVNAYSAPVICSSTRKGWVTMFDDVRASEAGDGNCHGGQCIPFLVH